MLGYGSVFAQAVQKVDPSSTLQQKAERGWFFYEDPVKPKEPKPTKPKEEPKQEAKAEKPPEDECKSADTWTAKCGFVDPGTDFNFQAKQRDALLENMTMSQNDPKAVEAFQYYMKWVMGRASEVANLWYYNMVQNPDLDASAAQPVSAFGLRLMTDVQKGHAEEIFQALRKDEAMLVYFTRSDCQFCHAMAPNVNSIAQETGLPVWNAALDDTCIPGFEAKCRTGAVVQKPAQALQVSIVPTLFLHVPPTTWLRLSTGVTDQASIMARTVSFFSAYRKALLKGVDNGDGLRPSVDFSSATDVTGLGVGVTPSKTPRTPTDAEVRKLLQAQ
jgi:conjugal transfer pilus assembly protein TraF